MPSAQGEPLTELSGMFQRTASHTNANARQLFAAGHSWKV